MNSLTYICVKAIDPQDYLSCPCFLFLSLLLFGTLGFKFSIYLGVCAGARGWNCCSFGDHRHYLGNFVQPMHREAIVCCTNVSSILRRHRTRRMRCSGKERRNNDSLCISIGTNLVMHLRHMLKKRLCIDRHEIVVFDKCVYIAIYKRKHVIFKLLHMY